MMRIAIDGPAASGKGTLALKLCSHFGFAYIDTGAIYRAITYLALQNGIDVANEDSVAQFATAQNFSFTSLGEICHNGKNLSAYIRTAEMSQQASIVSSYPKVRDAIFHLQQELAAQLGQEKGVVMDGRDIGTVIIPDAEIKFYIDADVQMRAKRRFEHNVAHLEGFSLTYENVLAELMERDERDKNREIAPLKQADDAILVDTTHQTIDESFAELVQHVEAKQKS